MCDEVDSKLGVGLLRLAILATVLLLVVVAIPHFRKFREEKKEAAIEAIFAKAQQVACGYYERIGTWPCSAIDLNAPELIVTIQKRHWTLNCDCRANTITLIYPQNDKDHYKEFNHNSGKRREWFVLQNIKNP